MEPPVGVRGWEPGGGALEGMCRSRELADQYRWPTSPAELRKGTLSALIMFGRHGAEELRKRGVHALFLFCTACASTGACC